MPDAAPLWPTRLHHARLDSAEPERLVAFYERTLGLTSRAIGEHQWLVDGAERRLVIGRGRPSTMPYYAYDVGDVRHLASIREALAGLGVALEPSPTPLFPDAVSVRDPDGNLVVLGVPARTPAGTDTLPGRLQHVVFASAGLPAMVAFYRDVLGFLASDRVVDHAGDLTACFFRSDPEHHSFAAFRAQESRLDHHCYETTAWNDIRDWADHFAAQQVPLWWGPGRHGPGNNLFVMVSDPDGNHLEFSAELERVTRDTAPGEWRHEERTLNLWGRAWMR